MFCIEVCFMVIKCFIWYLHLIFTYATAQILALTIFIRIKQTNIIENNWLVDRLHFFFFFLPSKRMWWPGNLVSL